MHFSPCAKTLSFIFIFFIFLSFLLFLIINFPLFHNFFLPFLFQYISSLLSFLLASSFFTLFISLCCCSSNIYIFYSFLPFLPALLIFCFSLSPLFPLNIRKPNSIHPFPLSLSNSLFKETLSVSHTQSLFLYSPEKKQATNTR